MVSTGSVGHHSTMSVFSSSLLQIALIFVTLLAGQTMVAGEQANDRRHDHDLARQGQMQQTMVPLRTVITAVHQNIPGDIAGIELERRGANWLYEIKVISPKGVMIEVHIDAGTGAILPDREK